MKQKTAKISIIQRIKERILGKKFYIAVIAQKGSAVYFVNSTIYRSEKQVLDYKHYITTDQNMKESFDFIGIYSFRSHFDFRTRLSGKPVSTEEAKQLAEEGKRNG